VTVVNCMSTTGQFIPQILVFPRKYMKRKLVNGTPPGSIHAFHPSGWLQSEIFTRGFFISLTYKAHKTRSSYLGNGRALCTHKEPEVIIMIYYHKYLYMIRETPHCFHTGHKMGHLHTLLTACQKNHQPLQKHKCQSYLQKQQYNCATPRTTYHNHTLPYPTRHERHILINMQHLQTSVRRSD